MTNTPQIDSSLLDQLSPQEREIALRALKEISSQGSSKLYNDLRYADYEELPVDVMTFLTDSRYLGRGLLNDNGDLTVFPYWQKLLVEMFPDPLKPCVYNTLALSGAIGLGKAQPLTSPVLTAQGFIPMGSVTIDDLVYGQDGNLHKVLGIFPQGRKQVYRISFSDHTSTLCCKDHLWKVKHSNSDRYQVLTTGELLAERLTDLAGRPRWSIPICQPINFPDSSKQLLDFTNITLDQPVPQKLLYSSISVRTSLICQLLKAGGYLSADDQSVYFSTTNYQLSQDVIWLTQSLGGTGYLESVTNQCYKVKLALPQIVYQSCDFFEWKTSPQSPERLIVDIQPAGEEFCQCILIDSPQHLYLTNDFIVTHNTMVAVLAMLYELYRMLCLKDPYNFYGLQPIDKITFALMNITLDASRGVAWDKLQQLVQSSPWFMSHGTVSGTTNVEWQPPKGIELVAGSQSRHIIGRAVFCAFFDEISFRIGQDIGKQKEQAKNLVNTAAVRMQSRFMKGEYNPTLLLLASSKRTESSYMEEFIAARKRQDSKTTRIIDEPQWIIRTDKDSPNKFKVAVGNKFLENELLPLNPSAELIQEYRDKGYQLLDVPMGYYEAFYEDINVALTDIAGISTSNSNRYFAGPRIATVKNLEYQNLFTKDIIEVGNGPNDTTQYWNYIDLSRLRRELISKPLYIHMDMSISGDKTGIAGVWIRGKKPPKEGEVAANDLFYTLAFSVSVKAPKGYQVSFEKNRQFIYWLKSKGFNIRGITTDSFQAADSGQALASKGYNYSMISVDRVDTDRICKPYQYLRSTIYEERVEIYDAPLLVEELIGLERDVGSGKIDHSPSGINCFTGDTRISLLDGREVSIEEISRQIENYRGCYVYSYNQASQKIEPKRISNAWCSGHSRTLVEVELDNGEKIRCTPQHRFMLRDGTYQEAQNLESGTSLMPLYRKHASKGLEGYRLYYEPMEDAWHYEHRRFALEVLDERHLVHHKNCNKQDNSPNNLVWMSRSAHIKLHSQMQTGAQSPAARQKRSIGVAQSHQRAKLSPDGWLRYYKGTPEERKEHRDQVEERKRLKQQSLKELNTYFNIDFKSLDKETQQRYRSKYANVKAGNKVKPVLGPSRKELKQQEVLLEEQACKYFSVDIRGLNQYELHSLVMRYIFKTREGYQENLSQKISENHKLGKYENAHKALENRVWWTNGSDNLYLKRDAEPPEGYHRGRTWKNHKVVRVTLLAEEADVYDIEVEDNHNFALTAGVFVHNSKDQADAFCGAVWRASQDADRYAFEYGEDIEEMVAVSTDSSNSSDTRHQIQVDFEAELQKIMTPASIKNQQKKDQETFLDFGNGPAEPIAGPLIGDGMIIW